MAGENEVKPDNAAEAEFIKEDVAKTPREIALAEIAARHAKDTETASTESYDILDDDTGEITPAPKQAAEVTIADEGGDEPDPEAQADADGGTEGAPAGDAPPEAENKTAPATFDPNKEYTLIVDGREIKVPGAKIFDAGVRTFQKETSADLKLNLASQLLREAMAKNGAPPQGAAPTEPKPEDATADVDLAKAIQFGTEEQAAQAIKALRTTGKAQSPQEIESFVRAKVSAQVKDELAFTEASTFMNAEYGDLLKNPHVRQLFFIEEERRRQAGDASAYKDLYKTIGDDLRKSLNMPKAAVSAAPTRDERIERKRTMPTVPVTAAARLQAGTTETKPRTASEIIAAMQEQRGQHTLNHGKALPNGRATIRSQ